MELVKIDLSAKVFRASGFSPADCASKAERN